MPPKQPAQRHERQGVAKRAVTGVDGRCGQGGSEHGDGIEAVDPGGAVHLLKEAGQKPEGKEFEEGADDAGVNKAVGKWLPEKAVEEGRGIEGEQLEEAAGRGWGHQLSEKKREVGGEVGEDQGARGASEIREGKRGGADSAHRSPQGIRLGGPVSWGGKSVLYRKSSFWT